MRMEGLSFDNIPPLHIPFRFFNTAPWLGVLAAVFLMLGGDTGLSSQWTPTLLAVTHLFTLGFMVMVMFGALFQLLPVISGEPIPKASLVATLVHLPLSFGILFLVCGFLEQSYQLFYMAIPLLITAFSIFLFALGSLLIHRVSGGASIYTVRLAALSLLITIVFGLLRASAYLGYGEAVDFSNTTYIHLAWGLFGWVMLLVIGVSYQVIPMFHVTPPYPEKWAKVLPTLIFTFLVLLTFVSNETLQIALTLMLILLVLTYAIYSLWLLTKRKRKIRDLTVYFWRLALLNIILVSLLVLVKLALWQSGEYVAFSLKLNMVIGLLAIYGFACSVIMGMLQKIVPFLAFLHLQRQCMTNFEQLKTLPNMREIISEAQSSWQFCFHLIALVMLVVSVFALKSTPITALAVALDFIWLGVVIGRASRLYRLTSARIAL